MSIEYSTILAHGFLLTAEEGNTIPEDTYISLIEEAILFPLSTWASPTLYTFALDYTEIQEDTILNISAHEWKDNLEYLKLFYSLFPNRAEEQPQQLLFISTT